MFEDRSASASTSTDNCCKTAAAGKPETDTSVNLLSAAKGGSEKQGCPCGCGGAGGCCGGDKNKAGANAKGSGQEPEGKKDSATEKKKTDQACCPCCGAAGGCCCGGKKEAGKEVKDLVIKGLDYVNSAGFPKVASVLKSIYEEGKSLLVTPLDCCDPKKAGAKPGGEACPCGCGGAGACCGKPKDAKSDDKEKSLNIPALDIDKGKDGPKKNGKDGCEGCKCGCGGAGACCGKGSEAKKADKTKSSIAPEDTGKDADQRNANQNKPPEDTGKDADQRNGYPSKPPADTGKDADQRNGYPSKPPEDTGKDADQRNGYPSKPPEDTGKDADQRKGY